MIFIITNALKSKYTTSIILLFFYVISNAQYAVDYKSDISISEGTDININIKEHFILGEVLDFYLTLKSKTKQHVFDFETARIDCRLLKEPFYNDPSLDISTYKGGNYYVSSEDGMQEILPKKQTKIIIDENSNYAHKFNLSKLFSTTLLPGKYKLLVSYEGQLYTSCFFYIIVNYGKSIPLILKNLENLGLKERNSRQTMFYGILLTGDYWYSKKFESDSTIIANTKKMSDFWNNNKELIVYVNNCLINEIDTSKIVYREVVPKLIKDLENKLSSEEKIIARDSLYLLIKRPEWQPNVTDSKEKVAHEVSALYKWWDENKELIDAINKTIVPGIFEW